MNLAAENAHGTVTLESGLADSNKVKHTFTLPSRNPTPSYLPKTNEYYINTETYTQIFILYSYCPKLDKTQMSVGR